MKSNARAAFIRGRQPAGVRCERRRDAQLTQALLRAIEQTTDSVFVTDRDGVITYVNPAFEKLTGFTASEAIGARPRLFKSGRHNARFYDKLWTTILSGQVFRFVVTNKSKDGRLYEEDQTITPIRDRNGSITHFVSTGRDITQRRRTEEALRRLNGQLELESARIAGVLHDEAGQFLTSAHMTLADIACDMPPPMQARLQQVRVYLDGVAAQLRRVSHELHPSILDDLGWLEAIKFIATSFARRNGMRVTVDADVKHSCPRSVATVAYRFVQEALSNIGKHAHASSVTIRLVCEGCRLRCSIRDDGVGFDAGDVMSRGGRRSLGLTLIRDRLEAVGATLQIVSAPGKGTELITTIPVEV